MVCKRGEGAVGASGTAAAGCSVLCLLAVALVLHAVALRCVRGRRRQRGHAGRRGRVVGAGWARARAWARGRRDAARPFHQYHAKGARAPRARARFPRDGCVGTSGVAARGIGGLLNNWSGAGARCTDSGEQREESFAVGLPNLGCMRQTSWSGMGRGAPGARDVSVWRTEPAARRQDPGVDPAAPPQVPRPTGVRCDRPERPAPRGCEGGGCEVPPKRTTARKGVRGCEGAGGDDEADDT